MKQNKLRLGWVVAVLAMVTMACTCGGLSGLGQAQGQLQTAQALATGVATSGVIGTAEALATADASTPSGGGDTTPGGGGITVGGVPDNIPVMDGAQNLVAAGGGVQYLVSADLKTAEDFYKKGMTDKGWTESDAPIEVAGVNATLSYQNDTQKAVVVITSQGGQTAVQIAVTSK